MSYLLQGSGAVLGPSLSHLISRDLLARVSPCICLKCSRLVSSSSVHDRGKSPARVQQELQSSQSQTRSSQLQSVRSSNKSVMTPVPPSPCPGPGPRTSFPSPIFRETHSASYQVPGSQLSINLSVMAGPDLITGVSYRMIHTSSLLDKKASSKLEETVIRLKEKQDEALAEISKVEDLEKKIANVMEQEDLVSVNVLMTRFISTVV